MSIEAVFHMNTANGDSSYASNSHLQVQAINRIAKDLKSFSRCFKIADLGCSSGPNTLFVVTNILDIVHDMCLENNSQVPQFQVFFNDLVENDFNTVFRSLPAFYSKLKKKKGDKSGACYVYAVPGSFYSRLFPNKNIHLFNSSYAVHWLSRVPQGLENNKLNIYMAKTSPINVFEAYRKQFEKDFTKLLVLRSHEMISGGHMILTFAGRSKHDPTSEDCCVMWELLVKSLVDMVKEGEVRDVIQKECSFSLHSVNGFALSWPRPGINTAKFTRAIRNH
ncbi:putative salicylate carboxymethyltransferase [Helianthus anomalus]